MPEKDSPWMHKLVLRIWDAPSVGQIEPAAVFWSVVPFEALDQTPGFDGREGFVECSLAVDAEIVLDQNDGLGVREVDVGQIFQDASVIHGGMAICDLDEQRQASRAACGSTPPRSLLPPIVCAPGKPWMVSRASMIRLSLHPLPASETSAFNKIRAFSTRRAGLFPFRIRV